MTDHRLTVLIIEDNPGDVRLFTEMLKETAGESFLVMHRDRLSAGLACLAENPIDAILLDLGLSDSQGIDTFLHVQKAYPHVPAIVLTGLRDNGLAIHAARQGAQDYLIKEQVTGDTLFRAIYYAIERKLAEAEIKLNDARMESLLKVARYDASASMQELLKFALEEAITLTGSEIGHIYFYDDTKKEFTLNIWSKEVMEQCKITDPQTVYALEKTGLCGEAARQGKAIVINDFQAPHPLKRGYPAGHAPLYRYLTLPVFSGERIVAVVGVANKRLPYGEADIRHLSLLADSAWKISRQRLSDAALRKSEKTYRSIVDNTTEGIYQTTGAGRYVAVNPSFAAMLGYESSAEVMESITDIGLQIFVHPEEQTRLEKIVKDQGYAKDFETEFHRKDGSRIWVSLSCQAIKDDTGRVLCNQGICEDITSKKQADEEKQHNTDRLRKALGATIRSLAAIVETRDPYTAGHQRRVADLARAIAMELGLAGDRIDGLRVAGMIHDIGKISIPAEILSMPRKLTTLEFGLIKTHPQSGYDILKDIDFYWPVAQTVLEHHERMNGSGYPHGVAGDKLLIESRILAVADVVEAIANHRPYRPALGIEAALEEILKNKAVLYDACVVDSCLKLFREKGYHFI